jgi:hypothetical protein
MTPADSPGRRRATDGPDDPKPDVGDPTPERSLWAKADLLDQAARRRPRPTDTSTESDEARWTGRVEGSDASDAASSDAPASDQNRNQAERRTDGDGRRPVRPDQPLWRKAEALDNLSDARTPGVTTDRTLNFDSGGTLRNASPLDSGRPQLPDAFRGNGSDRFLFPVHEQKSNEIIERERPLVSSVVDVVKKHFDNRSPEEWNNIQGRQRARGDRNCRRDSNRDGPSSDSREAEQ